MNPPRVGRLRSKAQFSAIAKARGPNALRAARQWLAASGLVVAAASDTPVHLGLVMPKRYARRAVDRNLIKRVVREAIRASLPGWVQACCEATPMAGCVHVIIVVRLKAGLPRVAEVARTQLKKRLRAEADALFGQLMRGLSHAKNPKVKTP